MYRYVRHLGPRSRSLMESAKFYALQVSASSSGTNLYNSKWRGPAPSTISYGGQLDAAYVLNGALGFALAEQGNSTKRYVLSHETIQILT